MMWNSNEIIVGMHELINLLSNNDYSSIPKEKVIEREKKIVHIFKFQELYRLA
jgi:hypothetical protein